MAYCGLIYPHLVYGITLWSSCALNKFEQTFRRQKRAIRTVVKLKSIESCRNAFRNLDMLTLPWLCMLEVRLYTQFEVELDQGRDRYGSISMTSVVATRSAQKSSFRPSTHTGRNTLLNKFPEGIKSVDTRNISKRPFKTLSDSRGQLVCPWRTSGYK